MLQDYFLPFLEGNIREGGENFLVNNWGEKKNKGERISWLIINLLTLSSFNYWTHNGYPWGISNENTCLVSPATSVTVGHFSFLHPFSCSFPSLMVSIKHACIESKNTQCKLLFLLNLLWPLKKLRIWEVGDFFFFLSFFFFFNVHPSWAVCQPCSLLHVQTSHRRGHHIRASMMRKTDESTQ